jgi:hypothetical protein
MMQVSCKKSKNQSIYDTMHTNGFGEFLATNLVRFGANDTASNFFKVDLAAIVPWYSRTDESGFQAFLGSESYDLLSKSLKDYFGVPTISEFRLQGRGLMFSAESAGVGVQLMRQTGSYKSLTNGYVHLVVIKKGAGIFP